MRTVMRCFIGAFASLIAMTAHAVQLGDLQGRLVIGQPVDAHIQVMTDPAAPTATVTLIADGLHDPGGASRAAVPDLRGEVVRDASGTYIKVTTAAPVQEPMLRFRLRYDTGDVALTRGYSIALQRPPPQLARSPTRASPRRVAIDDVPRPAVPSGAGRYGPVQPGETLWEIARDIRATSGGRIQDIMERLLADNPTAFIGGDMNRLRVGVALVVPDVVAVKPPATASPSASMIEETPAATNEPLVAAMASVERSVPPVATIDWRAQRPEHAAELQRLDDKFARIRARFAASSTAVRDDPQGASSTEEILELPAIEIPRTPTIVEADAEVSVTLSPVAAAEAAVTESRVAANPAGTKDTEDAATQSALLLISAMLAGGLLLGTLSFSITRRKAQASRQVVHVSQETERKQMVSNKAAQRIELEAEVRRIMEEHKRAKAELRVVDAPENDLTEVDLSITHGRYQRAELLLKEVIHEDPRNVDAKLRLVDVYYVTKQADPFLRVTRDLRAHHRHDLADDDWQKVVRMGRILCPDQPLFGRLSNVMLEARAV